MADDVYLVTAEEIAAMDGLRKTHFLNPHARRTNKSLGDLTGLTGIGVHLVEVAPGDQTSELHVHHHEDECAYVLAGTGTATVGSRSHAIKTGDFLGYRKGGEPHAIANTGAQTLRLLVVGARLPHDVCDYPERGKRLFRSEGLPPNVVAREAIEEPVVGRKV